jgi:hypothetical protein
MFSFFDSTMSLRAHTSLQGRARFCKKFCKKLFYRKITLALSVYS